MDGFDDGVEKFGFVGSFVLCCKIIIVLGILLGFECILYVYGCNGFGIVLIDFNY